MPRHLPRPIYINVKLILRCRGHFAMITYPGGVKDFPGGHIEFGESPIETLRREMKEEMGYDLRETPRLVDVFSFVGRKPKIHRITIGYLLDVATMIPLRWIETKEPITVTWVHISQVKKQHLWPEFERLAVKAMAWNIRTSRPVRPTT